MTTAISCGMVFRLMCMACKPQKLKYFVLVAKAPKPRFFLINSAVTDFQQQRAHLLAGIIGMPASANSFLSHDSYLDCTQALGGYTLSDLETEIQDDPTVLMGAIDRTTRANARRVVGDSALLSQSEIDAIHACL